MLRGFGLDPAQIVPTAQSYVDQMGQSSANQPAVVAALQQMDAQSRASVCAQMQSDCFAQQDQAGCQAAVTSVCNQAAQNQPTPAPTSAAKPAIGTTGAIVIGVGVVAALFWAIR